MFIEKYGWVVFIACLFCFLQVFAKVMDALDQKQTKQPTIRFVCTAAIIPRNYEERKKQYVKSLCLLKKYGIEPYLIESCATGPTFLDQYCSRICYTKTNNPALSNYGINEAISLLVGLKYFNFSPDDIIIKFTGRYSLESDEFIELVKKNPKADAIVRAWNDGDAYTALFAIKLKYFFDFLENDIDFNSMAQKNIPLEHCFGKYITKIRNQGANIIYLKRLYDYLPTCFPSRYIEQVGE